MRHNYAWNAGGALLLSVMVFGYAWAGQIRVDVRPGPLGDALAELAREHNLEILFSEDLVHERRVPALKARLTADQALSVLLAGTGVTYRVTQDGSFVLSRHGLEGTLPPDDGAISEVLVVGRRTQNADIRRTENDIQPYRIVGQRELAVAPQQNLDQYLRDRLPQNGQFVSPSQYVLGGAAANTAIDLRGVGQQRTLVLLDGRRLPSMPTEAAGLDQADLNAISLRAIERIETLTATAGGIHGPTAIGGVVNIVLKRDYRGVDVSVASGLASRGDAGSLRLEARAGFSANEGRTNVMLAASHATARPLTVGQRDYALRALQRHAASDPRSYMRRVTPVNAVVASTLFGEQLRLDPALGGTLLSSEFTFLPTAFKGDEQARLGALVANSGRVIVDPPQGMAGAGTSLVSTPRSASALFNVRHRVSSWLEGFVDGVYLRNEAQAYTPDTFSATLSPDVASNPFSNWVFLSAPIPDLVNARQTKILVNRTTIGAIASLPRQWRVSADYTAGRTVLKRHARSLETNFNFRTSGAIGAGGEPPIMPFADYPSFLTAVRAYLVETSSDTRLTTDLRSSSFRVAGPLAALPGGPLTLTLLGEDRRENIPSATVASVGVQGKRDTSTFDRAQAVRSGYVELRAPLVPRHSGLVPVRGLELQLALRRDDLRTRFPANAIPGSATALTTIRHRADVFTLGGRVLPTTWMMVRASMATGEAPPNLTQLRETRIPASPSLVDPKRGGRSIFADGAVVEVRGGSNKIKQEKGRTLSVGVVLGPSARGGPRVSVDFSRIDIRDEIVPARGLTGNWIDREDLFPSRVAREPLSAADAARGYTAGRITTLYTGYGNAGRTLTKTLDFQLDWSLPPAGYGQSRLYGVATWQPTLRSKIQDGAALTERAGLRDAPVEWRGNGGIEWSKGPLTVDLNVQHVGGYRTAWSAVYAVRGDIAGDQGAPRISSQTYVDLVALRHFTPTGDLPVKAFDVRLSVQNLFDRSPPIVVDATHMGYDYRGDPRRRRFEVLVSAKF